MQQPELGRRLTALRKELNLTQEELVEKSNVSVRTIQRIEAGEVLPRVSTVKILLNALGESPETFLTKPTNMETKTEQLEHSGRGILLTSVIAGAIYLAVEICLTAMDIAWLTKDRSWEQWINLVYIGLSIVMMTSYILFARGFILLSKLFENKLLTLGAYLMMATVLGVGILDSVTLFSDSTEQLWLPYSIAAIVSGTLTIVFGIALLRLQDGMGELARAAGILEILIGCTLVTVLLFFIAYVIMIPAIIVEILVLYRGYEYLSKSPTSQVALSA
ncbi:MAG: helix-turn-helix transcriptional regulator [Cyclobacteriaceae bacterium]|nr:helix-turn-helix transcriptional regulator [Cyclobacteriaceae bacterium]UYN87856.1 MAG: helix-turn-helix transcriptional regulator [Cyclobacteriaceae bacterium]